MEALIAYSGVAGRQSNWRARRALRRHFKEARQRGFDNSTDAALAPRLLSILRKEQRYKILTLGLINLMYRRANQQICELTATEPAKRIERSRTMTPPRPLQPFLDRVWAAGVGAENSEWPHVLVTFEAQKARVSIADLIKSTDDFGPACNRRNENTVLKAGTLLDPTDPEAEERLLKEGHGRFMGLEGTPDGRIRFAFEPPKQYPGPLVCSEDLDVALLLMFGQPKAIWPNFSLDAMKKGAGKNANFLRAKVWNPPWIANTLLGKTMYGSDYLMGQLAWQALLFEIRLCDTLGEKPVNSMQPTDISFDLDQADFAIDKSEVKRAYGVLDTICHNPMTEELEHFNLHPKRIDWQWATTAGALQCSIKNIEMAIYGGVRSYGAELSTKRPLPRNFVPDKRSLGWSAIEGDYFVINNLGTRPGRVGELMTREFETLARCWPILERQRQLIGLLYALHGLKERGFQPSSEILNRISNVKHDFMARPLPPQRQRLVRGHWW